MKDSLIVCSENIFQCCSKCGEVKPLIDFYYRVTRSKYHTICIICNKSRTENWRLLNNDKRIKYLSDNKEIIKIQRKDYYTRNKNKFRVNLKNNRLKNQERCRITRNKYMQKRRQSLDFKLVENYRRMLNKFYNISNIKKYEKSSNLIGCTPLEFQNYLCKQFVDTMSHINYGEWEIDHIIPCSFFNLQDKIELKQCFHYTNLRPLWKLDNIKKSDNLLNLNFNDLTPFI